MKNSKSRTAPRPFELHWGSGVIAEEATYAGEHHEPAIQLLDFDGGYSSVRFCWYDHVGRFQRSPLIVGNAEIAGLRAALETTPRLRALLKELAS